MAKSMLDAATKPKKIKPESGGLQRRNSTGGAALIFSEPIPIPNYLRASIGSCHDLCKYGSRRDSSATTDQRRNTNNMGPQPKYSKTSNRGNSSASSSVEQRRNKNNMGPQPKSKTNNKENSSAESAIAEQRRNRNIGVGPEPKSKTNNSACNARVISRNNEGKRVNSLPRTTSSESPSARIPTSKTRRSKSVPRKVPKSGSEKLLESSECCKKSEHCDQTVEEKIINVVETNDQNQNQNQNQNEDVDDENQKMDSARNDCCSRKLGLKKGVIDEDTISWKDIRLRRVVSEGDSENMKKECMRIVVMGRNKVRALVDSFETLMSTPDSQGSRASSTSP